MHTSVALSLVVMLGGLGIVFVALSGDKLQSEHRDFAVFFILLGMGLFMLSAASLASDILVPNSVLRVVEILFGGSALLFLVGAGARLFQILKRAAPKRSVG